MMSSADRELLYGDLTDAILADLRDGRRPDLAALARRFPGLNGELEAHVAQLEALLRCGAPPEFADYRALREVARGGMGLVYEAERVSDRRRVALKVLPFANLADPLRLQRFRHEAEAAARLEHPHIVPVLAVGCENGLPYYAMPFIDGRTLAAVVRERRDGRPAGGEADTPVPARTAAGDPARVVARWGVQAAEALHYAHQVGVVHRDVKPANLLVDAAGDVWVTDFGLARLHDQTELTATGNAVGTLRYMSPEQALGIKGVADHRVDVYGLGCTLYELLTLEPAVPGATREEVVRHLFGAAPRLPRAIDPGIPFDLETVVLKALRKDPADRYATAGDLAADLKRFLAGQPVAARRPTRRARARDWLRRHAVATAVATGAALAVSVLLAVATGLTLRAYHAARTRQAEADAQRELARQTVDDMTSAAALEWFEFDAHVFPMQEEFLRRANEFYQGYVRDRPGDPDALLRLARSHRQLADTRQRIGKRDAALDDYGQALALLDALPAGRAGAADVRLERSHCSTNRGIILQNTGRGDEADASYSAGIALTIQLLAEQPDDRAAREALANGLSNRGSLRMTAAFAPALADLEEALQHLDHLLAPRPGHPPYLYRRAHVLNNYAKLLRDLGRRDEGKRAIDRAVESGRAVVKASPTQRHYRFLLATTLGNSARVRRDDGELAAAEAAAKEALALATDLKGSFPQAREYQELAAVHAALVGGVLLRRGDVPGAEKALRPAIDALKQLHQADPADTRVRVHLAEALKHSADAARRGQKPAGAVAELLDAVGHHDALAAAEPTSLAHPTARVDTLLALADAYLDLGRDGDAGAVLRRAGADLRNLTDRGPLLSGHGPARPLDSALRDHWNQLSTLWDGIGRSREGLDANLQAVAIAERLAATYPGDTRHEITRGVEYGNRAAILVRTAGPDEARPWAEKAADVLVACAKKAPADRVCLEEAAHAAGVAAAYHVRAGQAAAAEPRYREQREFLRRLAGAPGPGLATLAWHVATCPVPALWDREAAAALIDRLDRSPGADAPPARVARAALYNRLGRHRDAADVLVPLTVSPPPEPLDFWAQAAIAQHHLGRPDRAREWLRRAVQWAGRGGYVAIDRQLLLAEVNALLGDPEPKLRLSPPVGKK